MAYRLKDYRDKGFLIESDTLEPIKVYLGIDGDVDAYDIKEILAEQSQGMAEYYLEED